MPSWGELLAELKPSAPGLLPDFDGVRRKYLAAVHAATKRNVILYASKFTEPDPGLAGSVSITDEDLQGIMDAVYGLKGTDLDLILHSPGGSPEATEAIGKYLRTKFKSIRVIVPHLALSAASMLSFIANEIVMGKHSFLGPIDPQFLIGTPTGARWVSAQDILEQFERANIECQDQKRLPAWIPMLSQYGPDLLEKSTKITEMVEEVVRGWMLRYMFKVGTRSERRVLATSAARYLANHGNHFRSHSRHLDREELRKHDLNITDLEANQKIQDAVLSVYHAATHTFNGTGVVKIIENHMGRCFMKTVGTGMLPMILPTMGQSMRTPGQAN